MKKVKTLEGTAKTRNSVHRLMFCLIAMVFEIAVIVLLFTILDSIAPILEVIIRLIACVLVLYIYSANKTATWRMPWIILILVAPVFGVILYYLVGQNKGTKRMRERYQKIDEGLDVLLAEKKSNIPELAEVSQEAAGIAKYIREQKQYPVYQNTDIVYYDDAAKGLEAQLTELAKAEHFIFMEYHAIENESSWKRIQDVLEDRVAHGVEVRVFYDDMGSIGFINLDFVKQLEGKGIQCRVFNPFMPGLNVFLNNRDHRKITVIDGKVGFTGGYNLANEYFNVTHPYGMWKDTGIRLEGDAVYSLTITFLEMWNAVKPRVGGKIAPENYLPSYDYKATETGGFVQPYAFGPIDEMRVGEDVYISMVEKAIHYCWFITPYLIITDEMKHALRLASQRGVDVRIITPGIPDKKMVYGVTRSFYSDLVSADIRIYEWTPGFCHCKMCVVDDKMAICGTINLDYRSLYHHFENGCFMVNCKAVLDIKADFEKTYKECREVTEQYQESASAKENLKTLFLRFFAQLM